MSRTTFRQAIRSAAKRWPTWLASALSAAGNAFGFVGPDAHQDARSTITTLIVGGPLSVDAIQTIVSGSHARESVPAKCPPLRIRRGIRGTIQHGTARRALAGSLKSAGTKAIAPGLRWRTGLAPCARGRSPES